MLGENYDNLWKFNSLHFMFCRLRVDTDVSSFVKCFLISHSHSRAHGREFREFWKTVTMLQRHAVKVLYAVMNTQIEYRK